MLISIFNCFQVWRSHIRDTSVEFDKFKWRCKVCKTKVSVRDESFFSKQGRTAQENLTLFWMFSYEVQICMMSTFLGRHRTKLCRQTIGTYWNLFRDLMTADMARDDTKLGGPGMIVELDESYFSGKRKANVGRVPGDSRWIFGMLDITTKKCAVFFVADRSARTLLRKIRENIADGSVIHTDGWRAYNRIGRMRENYVHRVVIHDTNFVDPNTGVNTQNIENFWGHLKAPWKRCRGVGRGMVGSYLDEIQWRWNNKTLDAYVLLRDLMAEFYPVNEAQRGLRRRVRALRPVIVMQ